MEDVDATAARRTYGQAIAAAPDFTNAYLNLGALLCESGDCQEAVRVFTKGIEHRPEEPLLYFNRAVALEDLNRFAEALVSYDKALQLDPNLADAHYNVGRLHDELGASSAGHPALQCVSASVTVVPAALATMRIATYNINDVRKRIDPLRAWLDVTAPDVVCLQELKCTEAEFPFEAVRAMGYEALVHGQRSWNGVAILSKGVRTRSRSVGACPAMPTTDRRAISRPLSTAS